jgi:CDP-diacylglycerol--glycerol-3-phosphate 3-phosphatidyltransferase
MTHIETRPSSFTIPNLLTYGRILAVPMMVAALLWLDGDAGRVVAALIFVGASVSDFFDGYLARIWDQQTALGRIFDPIADKLLVGTALVLLVHNDTLGGWSVIAGLIILCREILVSGLREYLAELRVTLHVSWLAKWKTVLQMVAISVLLAGSAAEKLVPGATIVGIALLWMAALTTLWTGYGYLRAALAHALRH